MYVKVTPEPLPAGGDAPAFCQFVKLCCMAAVLAALNEGSMLTVILAFKGHDFPSVNGPGVAQGTDKVGGQSCGGKLCALTVSKTGARSRTDPINARRVRNVR